MRRYDLYRKLERSLFPVYYKEITVTNNESSSLTGYQICIEMDDSSFLDKANPNKLLLVLSDNTVLPYWIEEWKHPSGKARIWTKIDLPASGKVQVRLFYGLSFDVEQDGDSVFEFFDDFDSDLNKWNETAISGISFSVVNSNVRISGTSGISGTSRLDSDSYVSGDFELLSRIRSKVLSSGDTHEIAIRKSGNDWMSVAFYNSSGDPKWRKNGKHGGTGYTIYNEDRIKNDSILKVRRSSSNVYSYYWDGFSWDEVGSVYTGFTTSSLKVRISTWSNSSGNSNDCYFDWIFVKKYTSNEPSVSVGEEQKVLSGICSNRVYINSRFSDYTRYMREITVTNNTASDLSNHQILVQIGGDFLEKTNPNSLVFTNSSNSILPYWVESFKRTDGKARIWVPVTVSGSGVGTLYLYYGGFVDNPPNGNTVFEFFDDFDGSSLDTNKWTVYNGSISIQNSNVILDNDDGIESLNSFSGGYVFESRCYATEQDSNFLCLYIDSDNQIELGNSDSDVVDNFERIRFRVKESGTYYDIASDKLDFRGVHKRYKLVRKSNNYIDAYQESSLIGSQTTHIPSGDAKIRFNVWDSSQESTMYVDWVFVRKYVSSDPTVSIGSEIEYYKVW